MSNGDGPPELIHWLWNAMLTLLGGLLMLFVNDNRRQMEKKADREIVDVKFNNLETTINELKELAEHRARRMEEMHIENGRALNDIQRTLNRR